jgi:Xaa-Pro aminopeptidase
MRLAPPDALGLRHARIREQFDALQIDALLVTHLPNVLYVANHPGSAGVVILTRDAVHLLVDARYAEAVRARQASDDACPSLRFWTVPDSYDEAVIAALAELGVRRVGIEAGHLTVARYDWFRATVARRAFPLELCVTSEVIERERMVKDSHEVAMLRTAGATLDAVAAAAFSAAREGTKERDVAGAIESAMRRSGYDGIAFDTIVASGPNAALPHYRAGDRRLARGDLVVLDFGAILDGYCCDLTRTISVGPPDADARRVYEAVRDAQQAAIEAVRPGVTADRIDQAARTVLEQRGLGEAFGHGTGHGLGLEVHELPRVTRLRPDTQIQQVSLTPGMVFTIEPGAYLPGWGGVRIEDDVLVTETGCELLTHVTRELLQL